MANNFSEINVFGSKRANSICDLVYFHLVREFPAQENDPSNHFVHKSVVLSGLAAAILQGTPNASVSNITFEVDNPSIFKWLAITLPKIFKCRIFNFKNRIQLEVDGIYFEFWICEEILAVAQSKYYIQDISLIPENLL